MSRGKNTVEDVQESVIAELVALAKESGHTDSYAGKRAWTRWQVSTRFEMTTAPNLPPAPPTPNSVLAHSISGGGLGFWARRPLPVGSSLLVRAWSDDDSQPWLSARVAHCTAGIRGFLVGVLFDAPTPPDQG